MFSSGVSGFADILKNITRKRADITGFFLSNAEAI